VAILTVLIGVMIASGGVVALVFRRIQDQHKEVIARAERLGSNYSKHAPAQRRGPGGRGECEWAR